MLCLTPADFPHGIPARRVDMPQQQQRPTNESTAVWVALSQPSLAYQSGHKLMPAFGPPDPLGRLSGRRARAAIDSAGEQNLLA